MFFVFKQKTAYEMRISDWSSDVCSSDLAESMRNEYSECNRVGRLKAPTAYHPMSRLSDNLTARRKQLGLTVPQVHAALQLMGVDVAKPTVYGWLNGDRKSTRLNSSH